MVAPSGVIVTCRAGPGTLLRATIEARRTSTVATSPRSESVTYAMRPQGGGVPRLAEAPDHPRTRRVPASMSDETAERGVRDERRSAYRLDAPRSRESRDPLRPPRRRRIDRSDVGIEIGGDERQRESALGARFAAGGEARVRAGSAPACESGTHACPCSSYACAPPERSGTCVSPARSYPRHGPPQPVLVVVWARDGAHGRDERAPVRGAQRGSASDLEALFRIHWRRAHRAAYLVIHDAAAAEDIAQEAFLAAVRASTASTAGAVRSLVAPHRRQPRDRLTRAPGDSGRRSSSPSRRSPAPEPALSRGLTSAPRRARHASPPSTAR